MKELADYFSLPYMTYIIPDEGVDGKAYYRAEHPQLPGCMSHGQTPEEAFKNLADARRLYIQINRYAPENEGYPLHLP